MSIKKIHKGTAPAGGGSSNSVNPSIFDPKDPQHSAVITAVVKMKRKDGEGKFTAVTCEIDHGPLSGKTINTYDDRIFGKIRKVKKDSLQECVLTLFVDDDGYIAVKKGKSKSWVIN
jgi:hypothetical protein